MIKFLFGLFIGANLSLFLYACILAGARVDKEEFTCQKKDTTG